MTAKIATLIAVETGILIGMISWLGYSRFSIEEPDGPATIEQSVPAPKHSAPVFEASNPRPYPADYDVDREQARLLAERSASLAASYYQSRYQHAYNQPAPDNSSVVDNTPTYSDPVSEESADSIPEYVAPPTVLYYAQPLQTVIFNQPRNFRDRRLQNRHSRNDNPMRTNCPAPRNLHQTAPVVRHSDVVVAVPPRSEVAKPAINNDPPSGKTRRSGVPVSSKSLRGTYSAP